MQATADSPLRCIALFCGELGWDGMATSAYETLSKLTEGHDVVIPVHLSLITTLLDWSTLPPHKKNEIIDEVAKAIEARDKP